MTIKNSDSGKYIILCVYPGSVSDHLYTPLHPIVQFSLCGLDEGVFEKVYRFFRSVRLPVQYISFKIFIQIRSSRIRLYVERGSRCIFVEAFPLGLAQAKRLT